MTPLFRTRRRAEHFHSLVEGGRHDDLDSLDREAAQLFELVGTLRSAAGPQARPEFVADLRERLMLAAETELTPAPARHGRETVDRLTITPKRGRRERRIGLALGTVAIMGATTSMAVASQGAIPGDTLYPLKRAIENTQTGISRGDDAKGESIIGNASGRLDEVTKLTRKDKPDVTLVTQTLNTFAEQADQAGDHLLQAYQDNGDQESIQELQGFTQQSVQTLTELEPSVPPGAHDALLNAASSVLALDAQASNLCPDCGEPILELPAQLVNGVTSALDEATGALANGLGGGASAAPDNGAAQGQGNGDKPSGLNPPENPVSIPPVVPTPTAGLPDVDAVLPTQGGNNGGGSGTNNGGGSNNGGNGGKGPHTNLPTTVPPIDLTPVTEPLGEVVGGVLDGVGGLLGGLLGTAPSATPTP